MGVAGRLTTAGDINLELFLCTEVLGLSSLHYGYWNEGDDLTLDNLKSAQNRYTERLVHLMPAGVEQILDVGCGAGDIARALATNGYCVTAISPDRNHQKYFDQCDSRVWYVKSQFEDLQIDRTFDLILMAESQNYIDTKIGLEQCQRYLRAGGYLLVSGIFMRADAPHQSVPDGLPNTETDFVRQAARHGLQLVSFTDITKEVLPTLEFCRATYRRYVVPIIDIADLWIKRKPFVGRLARFALRREMRRLDGVRRHYEHLFDPDLFARHRRYVTLLFVSKESGR